MVGGEPERPVITESPPRPPDVGPPRVVGGVQNDGGGAGVVDLVEDVEVQGHPGCGRVAGAPPDAVAVGARVRPVGTLLRCRGGRAEGVTTGGVVELERARAVRLGEGVV